MPLSTIFQLYCCSPFYYEIKFFSDLRQVCGFLQALRFPQPIKLEYNWNPCNYNHFDMFYLTSYLLVQVLPHLINGIRDVMVSALVSSAVDRGFKPRSDQTKDCTIGICWFSSRHAVLWSKSKDWLAGNGHHVFKWSGPHHHLIENLACSHHDIAEKLLSNNRSLTHSFKTQITYVKCKSMVIYTSFYYLA